MQEEDVDNDPPVVTCNNVTLRTFAPNSFLGLDLDSEYTYFDENPDPSGITYNVTTGVSGDLFPPGQTPVTMFAIDDSGNQATCLFYVQNNLTELPVTCPELNDNVIVDPGETTFTFNPDFGADDVVKSVPLYRYHGAVRVDISIDGLPVGSDVTAGRHEVVSIISDDVLSMTCTGILIVEDNQIVCRNKDGIINCGERLIKIVSAVWGRTDASTCDTGSGSVEDTDCEFDVISYMSSLCDDKTSCTFKPKKSLFGRKDPCKRVKKYLDITHTCEDIDECSTSEALNCDTNARCIKTDGSHTCECNDGFVGDGVSCNEVEVSCSITEMTIKIPNSALEDPHSLHLQDSVCRGFEDSDGNIVLSTPYDQCGTAIQSSGDNIIFSNVVNGLEGDTPNGGSLDLPFQCVFRMDQVVDGTPIDVTSEKIISNKGFASFQLTLERYSDGAFTSLASDEKIWLGDELLYAVTLNQHVSSKLTMSIDSCWATPEPESNAAVRYDLIKNRCKDDSTVRLFNDLGHLKQGFSFEAFTFPGDYGQKSVYIHCSVSMCVTTNPQNQCQQGCIHGLVRRSSRSLSNVIAHTVSSGRISVHEI